MSGILKESKRILNYLMTGLTGGLVYACIEYFARRNSDDPQTLIPLMIRAGCIGALIFGTVIIFETWSQRWFSKKPFIFLLIARSTGYTLIITLSLLIVNGAWFLIRPGVFFQKEMKSYLQSDIYLINLLTIFSSIVFCVAMGQINNLHKKGELLNFILGRYHRPREVSRIFCFIDLKNSTSIAENLGHLQFAMFLRDYYSDISKALQSTAAQIYQYVGDEIVLSWSFSEGLKDNNLIECVFRMKKILNDLKQKYVAAYGVFPEFRAGLHGGKVIVTWIGELKKEIVYIGDTVNTTSRIQEECKRLERDFLISGEMLRHVHTLGTAQVSFMEEVTPRGRLKPVKLYSLEECPQSMN